MYKLLASACLAMMLAACSSFEFPGVYRLEIDQGNIITQEMVDQLEIGMSRSQVEFIMGTPLVRDTFNPDRWDYVYTLVQDGERTERKQLSVFFTNDRLSKIDSTEKPSEKAKISASDAETSPAQ